MSNSEHQHRSSKKQTTRPPDKQTAPAASPGIENASLLELQRTMGNQAVQRMIANGRLESRAGRFNGLPPVRGAKDHIYRSPALQIRHSLKNMPIKKLQRVSTWAGEWTTDKYDVIKSDDGKTDVGVDIELRFKPNKHVDAKQIGTLQMVNSIDKGVPIAINDTVKDRSIPAGDPGAGNHIDQSASNRNPLYAVEGAPAADKKLTDKAPNATWGQHGWHYKDDKDAIQEQDALLKDTPTLPDRGANASQMFESTALAIEGTQEGSYYGSVQWGWQTDAKGDFTKLPLTVVSNDVPSGTFAAAADKWNSSKTDGGDETLDLNVASGKFTNHERVWLVSNPSQYKSTIMSKLDKDTRLEVTDKGDGQRFNKTSDQYKWWKVTIVEGTAIGQVGWVMQTLLSDTKSKK